MQKMIEGMLYYMPQDRGVPSNIFLYVGNSQHIWLTRDEGEVDIRATRHLTKEVHKLEAVPLCSVTDITKIANELVKKCVN